MSLQTEFEQNHFVFPLTDACQQWQINHSINLDWYYKTLTSFGVKKVLLDRLRSDNPFTQQIIQDLAKQSLAREHVVTVEEWSSWQRREEDLIAGTSFTILIYKELTPNFLHDIMAYESYLSQIKFVLIVRKDWDYRGTFRSIPSFMRKNLYVDFPISTYSEDSFFAAQEIPGLLDKMEKDFQSKFKKSYTYHLGFMGQGLQANISSISSPRKLTNNRPKISIISQNVHLINQMNELKLFEKCDQRVEVLLARVAGQKTQVVSKIKNVLTTRYWVHPIDLNHSVSFSYLNNFLSTQSDGDLLLFADLFAMDEIKAILGQVSGNETQVAIQEGSLVKKTDFNFVGGFDPAFTLNKYAWLDLSLRLNNSHQLESSMSKLRRHCNKDLKHQINFEVFARKNIAVIEKFLPLSDKAISVVKNEKLSFYKTLKINLSEPWRLLYQGFNDGSIFSTVSFIDGWLFFIDTHFYKKSYQLFFKYSYPLRKVYYFLNYQYEKRVLGLHSYPKTLQGK